MITPDPGSGRCQECALGSSVYIPCGKPATSIVGWKGRSEQPIPMCMACADHNVKNRGGEIVRRLDCPPRSSLQKIKQEDRVWKAIFRQMGGHFRIALFCAKAANQTYAKCGEFVVREEEFVSLQRALVGVTFEEGGS